VSEQDEIPGEAAPLVAAQKADASVSCVTCKHFSGDCSWASSLDEKPDGWDCREIGAVPQSINGEPFSCIGYSPDVGELARLRAEVADLTSKAERACVWTHDDVGGGWFTACGNGFEFTDGGPADNGHTFCGYCGGKITEGDA
jgi:hypothetical protein